MNKITIDYKKCNGCGICVKICPKGPRVYRVFEKKVVVLDESFCYNCRTCISKCPQGAIKIKG